jgi:hypothetical protein
MTTGKMSAETDQSSRPPGRPKARLPRGFFDATGKALAVHEQLIGKLAQVYASYGFEQLTTPCVEFADAKACSRSRTMTGNGWSCATI